MPAYTGTARTRGLTHRHPGDVPLQVALDAVADPVRRMILRDLAGHSDWSRPCGTFDLPVGKATRSHHEGARRLNRLRRPEFDEAFPGLLDLVVGDESC